jgi:hypothetical protein
MTNFWGCKISLIYRFIKFFQDYLLQTNILNSQV